MSGHHRDHPAFAEGLRFAALDLFEKAGDHDDVFAVETALEAEAPMPRRAALKSAIDQVRREIAEGPAHEREMFARNRALDARRRGEGRR